MKKLIFAALLGLGVKGLQSQSLPPKQAYPLDVKQIHSGHSLTDPLFGQPWPGQYVNLITQLRGVWAGDDIGKSTIPGSPIWWRWQNEASHPVSPKARHDINNWELLVITEGIPIPTDGGNPPQITPAKQYLSMYVNNAWTNGNQGNGAPTLLWTTWTNLNGSEGPWRQTLNTYEAYWEEMQDYANANKPTGATPVYLIPGHRMMARIYDDIQLNLVPGIMNINQFFSDNIHTNSLGDYAIAMIHYACIFNQSPVGLPNNLMPNTPGFQAPSPALASYLQNIIWQVVTSYPRTGITNTTSGINQNTTEINEIIAYPNPTTDVLFIKNKNANLNSEKILLNSIGDVVYKGTDNTIDLSSLTSGVYILKAGNQNIKIVKN